MPNVTVEAIKVALWWKEEQRLRLRPKYRDSGLLFVGERGRPLNPSNTRNRDHLPRIERLKVVRFRLHDLRHFHATLLIASRGLSHNRGSAGASVASLHPQHVQPRGYESPGTGCGDC